MGSLVRFPSAIVVRARNDRVHLVTAMLAARALAVCVLAVCALAFAACSAEPPSYPDWTVPVPEGTTIHEHRYVPAEERTEVLELERDLVISEGMGRGLYQPTALAVAGDGTLFVLDAGNYRVVAFDQQGNALREFGSQGQGPGEFQSPLGFGVAGERVYVSDIRNNRLAAFSTGGELVADTQFDDRFWARDISGVDDDGDELLMIVAPNTPMGAVEEPYEVPWTVARYSPTGEQRAVLVGRQASVKAFFFSESLVGVLPMEFANPVGAFAPDDAIYVTSGDQYQVLAVAPDGETRWALRTSFTPESLTEERRVAIIDRLEERQGAFAAELGAELAGARMVWPENFAAVENIEADGQGNLCVFPYEYRPPDSEPGPELLVPVDVYSPEGAALFAGMSPINQWQAAYGEHVFRLEDDADTGERVVARYRIVTPE